MARHELIWTTDPVPTSGSAGVIVLNGARMTTVDGLMEEFSNVLQFPEYFGANWPALDECLTDLDWLPRPPRWDLHVAHAAQVLTDEPPSERETLDRLLRTAMEVWAAPVEVGEEWDRPAIPMQVYLHRD